MKGLREKFTAIMLLLAAAAHAQEQPVVSGSWSAAPLPEVLKEIEQQTGYTFYYRPDWIDSLTVDLKLLQTPLKDALKDLSASTGLHFGIYERSVFITRDRPILNALPPGFFGPVPNALRNDAAFDFSMYERREKERELAEKKIHLIGRNTGNMNGDATVAGHVRDVETGEPLIGASVFVENPLRGITTDQFGYYSLTLPRGRHELKINSVGMKSTTRQITLYSNGRLDVDLEADIRPLKEVTVEADGESHILGMQMGTEKLDISTMKQIPLALGETDIMKVVLTLPGVQSVGEGTVGLNVRGGAANQNLILLNDAVVYNPSHLFGFFSTFNPDVLKNVDLYKSAIQAEYGGRLSSVLDVHTREGNNRKFSGSGGISPITGRFTVEGPVIKDKTSFILGGRSTYSGWLLRQLDARALRNSTAAFYDITAHVSHRVDENNQLFLSAYRSRDRFTLDNDTAYSYSDRNASLKWKHLFNNRLYGVLTTSISNYRYSIDSDNNPVNAFKLDFNVRQAQAKAEFSFFPTARHTLNAGVSVIRYDLAPGSRKPLGNESMVVDDVVADEQGVESAVFISENFDVTPKLSLYLGLRYSHYQFRGPGEVYSYAPGLPRQTRNIIDTLSFATSAPIVTYHGAEPRFSLRYVLSKSASLKLSYNRMRQYIQMLSNTVAINPTDIWKLSDRYVKPQVGDQVSLGFYKYLRGNTFETSIETYYKNIERMTDYKDGAVLLLNHHLETDVVDARGKAYGVEFMIKKVNGKLNGWVSYTWSRTLVQALGEFADETVNDGAYYPANYDKPHAANFIGNYKFSRRFNFSLNLIYSTGRPITLPIAQYEVNGVPRILYSERNQYRIPDYVRTDVSINIEGNHKVKKLAHSSWTFAVYNLLGRANPYSIYFVSENGKIAGYKLSIFARPIPTITYNFKF